MVFSLKNNFPAISAFDIPSAINFNTSSARSLNSVNGLTFSARGYPHIRVDGFNLDEPSIERARANAKGNHLEDRVYFQVQDASDPALTGYYDLVTCFEVLHDMNNPVGALQTMRRLVKENGTVLIVDERVGDSFIATGNDVECMMYGWSILPIEHFFFRFYRLTP